MIQESDLTEGLRVLIKLEGHFYPGQIQAISPPDIYGVLVDRERGNKPHIFSREEVLQDAVSFIFCIFLSEDNIIIFEKCKMMLITLLINWDCFL